MTISAPVSCMVKPFDSKWNGPSMARARCASGHCNPLIARRRFCVMARAERKALARVESRDFWKTPPRSQGVLRGACGAAGGERERPFLQYSIRRHGPGTGKSSRLAPRAVKVLAALARMRGADGVCCAMQPGAATPAPL